MSPSQDMLVLTWGPVVVQAGTLRVRIGGMVLMHVARCRWSFAGVATTHALFVSHAHFHSGPCAMRWLRRSPPCGAALASRQDWQLCRYVGGTRTKTKRRT